MEFLNPSQLVISSQPKSVDFGFYTDKDVRERSVVEITSTEAYGPTGSPLPGGLYDPRMGPMKDNEPPCPTCALRALYCPGHFGHIECAVPVHHPLLLKEILNILHIKCLCCHKLRLAPRQIATYRAKFYLLQTHQLDRFHALEEELLIALREARGENQKASTVAVAIALDAALKDYQPTEAMLLAAQSTTTKTKFNSYETKLRKDLIAQLISDCKASKKCPHCSAHSPKIRQDSSNKVFRAPLSRKYARINAAEGLKIEPAILEPRGEYDSDDDHHGVTKQNQDLENTDDDDEDDSDNDDESSDDGEGRKPKTTDNLMHTGEVQAQLKRTWETDPFLLNAAFGPAGSFDRTGYEFFFLQAIPVPPSRFRPPMSLNGMSVLHSQTQYFTDVLKQNEVVRSHLATNDEKRAYTAWIELQTTVNCLMDSSKDPSGRPQIDVPAGIKQILERKEGLFRKNMMGKRVDHACRSVISPDPYIGTNEIGVPKYFATVLTYPTPVTDLNIKEMRELVTRGPDQYPGARWVEIHGRRLELSKVRNANRREAIAAQLLTHLKKGGRPAVVGRQLRDGDYVLMNRQPTLHKPGIMAHRVRVLSNPAQKTIRMHYANCNTYNADFDGDEMNCHFPQNDLAQAEAQYIAKTDLQYIVPTDGSPLRGLIQDHVIAGVKMTKKDTFLEKWEYQQLLFIGLASLPGLEVIRSDAEIELLPPALIKPRELWTGKQVISTLLLHIQKGCERDSLKMRDFPGISTERKSKTPASAFGSEQEEHLVLIRDGELLRGVLDKSAFGATDFSLVHAVYEAYGPERAGIFLNSLSRLFTGYIQYFAGHSCRTEDLILTAAADKERRKLVQRAYNLGARAAKAWADSEGGKIQIDSITDKPGADAPLKPVEKAAASAKIGELLSGNDGKANFAALDGYMQGQLNPLASDIVKKTLPSGLVVPFPFNTFGIMTTTGAKGSIVNQSQVICALGQQALEGRRVPRLSSGRTLPSFAPYDPNPRADGFVMDRFLTGVRPQEYYFHCMAGREGLVDTAVKTSRSGYLQRCLIKHLEELKVSYDFTVRNAENSVVQFRYGEDSLDPTKAAFLDCTDRSFSFLARNYHSVKRHNTPLPASGVDVAAADAARNDELQQSSSGLIGAGARVLARKLQRGHEWKRGSICKGWFPAIVLKTHGSKYVDLKYINDGTKAMKVPLKVNLGDCGGKTTAAASSFADLVKPAAFDPLVSSLDREHSLGVSGACVSESVASAAYRVLQDGKMKKAMEEAGVAPAQMSELIGAKYSASLCAPGEAVGSIAAQSIGEPSTQMTLNTFHLAGAGANVTLGIPRLREIIMTASRELKTPTMSVPLHPSVTDKDALRLARDFTKLTLSEFLAGKRGVTVTEKLEQNESGAWCRSYYVKFKFHPEERIKEAFGLSLFEIANVVHEHFTPLLRQRMKKELRKVSLDGDAAGSIEVMGGDGVTSYTKDMDDSNADAINESPQSGRRRAANVDMLSDEDDEDMAELEEAGGDEDGAELSRARRRAQSVSYEDDGDDEDNESEKAESLAVSGVPALQEEESNQDNQMAPTTTGNLEISGKRNTLSLPALQVDPATRPLLMVGLVESTAAATIVRAKKKIDQGFVNDEDDGRGRCLQTAGINFAEVWSLDPEQVDHSRLSTNDIWAMRCAYGVEAARRSIVDQIRGVFGVYGITVDPRHLSLIADYMTFEGGFKAMNRGGMEASGSPLLQMSFETTVHFLKQAAMAQGSDSLHSPSANIVLGKPIQHGTGSFAVLTKCVQ